MSNPFVMMYAAALAAKQAMQDRAIAAFQQRNPFATLSMGTARTRSRTPGLTRPAGSKIARRFAEAKHLDWEGEIVHGGALTELNRLRAERRAKGLPVKGHAR